MSPASTPAGWITTRQSPTAATVGHHDKVKGHRTVNPILASPIVQLADVTDEGTLRPRQICVPLLTLAGMRELREAFRRGEAWGPDGERIITLIEDPLGVLGGAK